MALTLGDGTDNGEGLLRARYPVAPGPGDRDDDPVPRDHFGEDVAATYDRDEGAEFAAAVVDPAVDVLARLAGGGRALEFAVGTGRIAVPLAARGVTVHGIDLSTAMLQRLRAKPGAADVVATVGDMTGTRVPGTFDVVYLVFNTIMNLTEQDDQVACFRNAAEHLVPGGSFVVEVMVPDLQRLLPDETFRPFTVTPTRLGIDEYDVVGQRLVSHHYRVEDGRLHTASVPFRYVWPAELDLMARLAGMTLRHRWHDWHGASFTRGSRQHVSVWTTT